VKFKLQQGAALGWAEHCRSSRAGISRTLLTTNEGLVFGVMPTVHYKRATSCARCLLRCCSRCRWRVAESGQWERAPRPRACKRTAKRVVCQSVMELHCAGTGVLLVTYPLARSEVARLSVLWW